MPAQLGSAQRHEFLTKQVLVQALTADQYRALASAFVATAAPLLAQAQAENNDPDCPAARQLEVGLAALQDSNLAPQDSSRQLKSRCTALAV